VLPSPISTNIPNKHLSYAVFISKFLMGFTLGKLNLTRLGIGQLRPRVPLSSGSALPRLVPPILIMIAKEKVFRVYALRVIALVQDKKAFGYRPMLQMVTDPMSIPNRLMRPAHPKAPVTSFQF
jgi:hypothetical protein